MKRRRLRMAAWSLAPLVLVGSLVCLRALQFNGAFEPKPPAPQSTATTTDPFLKVPLPDPDSDVLFGADAAHISIVRYSFTKGFWAREEQISRSIGSGLQVDDRHYLFATFSGPFPAEIVAVDLESPRPWAAASVTQIGGTLYGTAFDATRHRYFVLASGRVHAFQVHGPNFKLVNTVNVNVNADAIVVDGAGRFLFTCPGQKATGCREFDIDAQTGAISPDEGREVQLSSLVHVLLSTSDGRFLLVPEVKPGIHRPPTYRLNPQGGPILVPGSALETPDVGYLRVYRLTADGTINPVPGSPFPIQHPSWSITLSPNGRFVYVGYQLFGAVRGEGLDAYSLDPKSGRLTLLPDAITPSHQGGETNPSRIIFGQSQERAFGTTRDEVIAYEADPKTGHLTQRARTFLWPGLGFVLSAPERTLQKQ